MISRRLFALTGTAAALTSTVARANDEQSRPLRDAFPFLERYLALPATTRDGFRLRYRLTGRDGGPVPQLTILSGSQRIPVRVGADGALQVPTDLALVRSARITAGGQRGSLTMDVVPVLPLGRQIPIDAIANSVGDYEAARRSAGPLALAAPRLRGVAFPGVTSGEAELRGGRRIALPRDEDGDVVVRPGEAALREAVTIHLSTAPARAVFSR